MNYIIYGSMFPSAIQWELSMCIAYFMQIEYGK